MSGRTAAVATTLGRVRGLVQGSVAAFRGIPFAAPPVGPLRFVPPHPHPGWTRVRDAVSIGRQVPQIPQRNQQVTGPGAVRPDEHTCLNLTVWTPRSALVDGVPRGVLLWFHGGGFVAGSGNSGWYDGARLADLGDIVVVTANYRLGPLGYLHLPELGADNVGLQDQAWALHWVRDNIAAFGGDPARITLGGQSAGAFSALYLALAPCAAGVIRRVICQSAPLGLAPQDPAAATEMTRLYLEMLGARTETELREVPVERMLKAYLGLSAFTAQVGGTAPPMYPVLGGTGIPRDWRTALADGALAGVDLLLGTNTDEMTFFYAHDDRLRHARRTDVVRILADWEGDRAEQVYDEHLRGRPGATPARVLTAAATEHLFHAGARELAAGHDPAYAYSFERRAPGDDLLGSTHCAELPFVFGNFAAFPYSPMLGPVSDADHEISRDIGSSFAAFVATGSPNADGRSTWPPYREGDATRIRRFG